MEFLENLAGSYPVPVQSASDDGGGGDGGGGVACSSGEGGGRRLAVDLATHRGRVADVLRRLPAGDAR